LSADISSRSKIRAAFALGLANVRYWSTVAPHVHRELHRWEGRARAIPDPTLRAEAIEKLETERFNTEVAATFATLAPRQYRSRVIAAIVALQVMYDYLDGISEQPAADPLENSQLLFSAFQTALTPSPVQAVDYYRLHRQHDDGGYLQSLVETCRGAFGALPGVAVVAPAAREAALRCGESQTRTHAIADLGIAQLEEWADSPAKQMNLMWWEYVAGSAASVLAVHAMIALAADARASEAEADRLGAAYIRIAAISALLDSLVDEARDLAEGSHSFIGYYPNLDARVERIGAVCAAAASDAQHLRHGAHHHMTAVGVAAYYLSAPQADEPEIRLVKDRVSNELGLLLKPTLGVFHLWRLARHARRPRSTPAS
jgi:tetraprenyl-beta-curcumene synthase